MPIILRNTPLANTPADHPLNLLGTIALPRNMSALSERLPAANYEQVVLEKRQPESAKHEHEKKPPIQRSSLANRGREIMANPVVREARALSESRERGGVEGKDGVEGTER